LNRARNHHITPAYIDPMHSRKIWTGLPKKLGRSMIDIDLDFDEDVEKM
jgi:hypothetical protein